MPPKIETIVGVHLERTGGTVISGERRTTAPRGKEKLPSFTLAAKSLDKFTWRQDSKEEAARCVHDIAEMAAKIGSSNLHAVGVAGPGPFQSLRRHDIKSETFGSIHPNRSHFPLQGLNLYATFKSEIEKLKKSPAAEVIIHTDAVACAIGESIVRQTADRTMLAFFIIGDGIGLGVVRGRSPLRSALHPEIGLLEVQMHKHEGEAFPIANYDKTKMSYSVAQMASNIALRERCNCGNDSLKLALNKLSERDREIILERRAYYLAQMCLACTVTLAPHQIVLGQDVDIEPDLAGRVWRHFHDLKKRRGDAYQPLFEYAELGQSDYVSNASLGSLGTTGALGMLHASLVADRDENGKFSPEMD